MPHWRIFNHTAYTFVSLLWCFGLTINHLAEIYSQTVLNYFRRNLIEWERNSNLFFGWRVTQGKAYVSYPCWPAQRSTQDVFLRKTRSTLKSALEKYDVKDEIKSTESFTIFGSMRAVYHVMNNIPDHQNGATWVFIALVLPLKGRTVIAQSEDKMTIISFLLTSSSLMVNL